MINHLGFLLTSLLLTTCSSFEVHKHMTVDELRSTFHVDHHDLVPEYDLVPVHHVRRREVPKIYNETENLIDSDDVIKEKPYKMKNLVDSRHNIRLKAFGMPFNLSLVPTEGLYKKGKLKIWTIEPNATAQHGVEYVELPEISPIIVMSLTFTLSGYTSLLSQEYYPPIELDPDYQYSLALIGFYTYNSIPNIEEGKNNKFYYTEVENNTDENKTKKKKEHIISIPTGAYEVAHIEEYLQKQLSSTDLQNKISLTPNNNTLKSQNESIYEINFNHTDSIGKLLGFSARVLEPNKLHESDLPVNIVKVVTIRIECDIVSGSYYNSKTSHTLYQFAPGVDPGYSINIEPRNLIYLPVTNQKQIKKITLTILDQNSNLINFRGEEIVILLELKKQK